MLTSGTSLPLLSLDRETGSFRDDSGLAHVLHGVNVVVKSEPYIADFRGSFDP